MEPHKTIIVKALLFNAANELLLIRRSETAPRRALEWDFPGGFVDDDDASFQAACLREIKEETGLSVTGNLLQLAYTDSAVGIFMSKPSDVSRLYFSGTVQQHEVKLSHEHVEATWVSLEKALQLITYDTQLNALAHVKQAQELFKH